MTTTRVRGRAARALVTVMLGLLAVFVAVPATPAAASGGQVCLPVFNANGVIIDWMCFPIEVAICPPPCGPWVIDLKENIVLPVEQEISYLDALSNGLQLVGAVAGERDPAVVDRLLNQAEEQFLTSARILGDTRVELGEVGFAEVRSGQVVPDPSLGWLEAAGTDVGNGIWQMQAALANPDPTPWVEVGMSSFISAHQHIVSQA
jgi:hypothetical protein